MSGSSPSHTLNDVGKIPWGIVSKVSKDAAVFLDDESAQLLHWAGGVKLLSGCVGVYSFFSEVNAVARDFIAAAPYCHVIIVLTSFLHGSISERLSNLLSDLQPLECHVFCSQSEIMHAQLIPVSEGAGLEGGDTDYGLEGYSHFGEFQALMRKWINREAGVRVSVQHLPLFQAEVCQGLLISPPYSKLFPLLPSDIVDIQARLLHEGETDCSLDNLTQVDFAMLTRQYQTSIKGFASSLNSFLEGWNMKEEIFSLGSTSRFIGNQLATMTAAKLRRKTASQQCSLLLIDRSLDMAGPSLHPSESLADRILSLLPRTSPCASDVCIDMSPLSSTRGKWGLNGNLAQPNHPRAKHILKTIICSKQKESLMELSRCLLDSLSEEGLPVKLSGKLAKPSALQLKTFIQQFKDHPQACMSQHAILQLACGVVEAMEGDVNKQWDRLSSIEKVLMNSLVDSSFPSIVAQLTEEVKRQDSLVSQSPDQLKTTPTPIPVAELLGVALAMFSLAGEEGCMREEREETSLKEAMTDLATKWRKCDVEFLESLGLAASDSRVRVRGRIESALQLLREMGDVRNHLTQFKNIFSPMDPSLLPYRPLLSQVTEAIFDQSCPELPDLNYHSHGGVTNILKSGFSLFMGSALPRPHQHPTLLLFVVGGITCYEVRQIREKVAACKTGVEVIIGSTRLMTSHDIIGQVLGAR